VPPTLAQRLRRFVLDSGSRRLDFRHPAVRALLVLLALGAVAALAAAAWMAYVDSRNAAVVINDPRVAYVNEVGLKIQAATESALAALPQEQRAGSPTVLIRVNHRGRLISATVTRSSGNTALDELALDIVRRTAPFEPFPLAMRRTTNIVEITSEFRFQ
jgi:TonB family protein